MAATWLVPGGPVVQENEDGADWLIPGSAVVNEAAAAAGYQISASSDDNTELNDTSLAGATATILNAGYNGTTAYDMALRWQSINIPQGSLITSAKLSVYLTADTGTLSANIRGIDEDNTATWSSGSRPSQRTKTSATITANEANWNNWATDSWTDIDITSVIQEIINRGGWSANNALAVVIEDTAGAGSNVISTRSYDYAGNLHGAKLDIVYTEAGATIPILLHLYNQMRQ